MQLIIHAPFGARINKAWGLALRKRFCHSFNFELQAAATDNGINISLSEQHSFPLADVFHFLNPKTVTEVLIQSSFAIPLYLQRAGAGLRYVLWLWYDFVMVKKHRRIFCEMLSEDLLAAFFLMPQPVRIIWLEKKLFLQITP